MFEAFQPSAIDASARRRITASTTAAMATYGLIGAAVATIARPAPAPPEEKMVEVTFEKVLPKAVELPPPPPAPRVRPKRSVGIAAPPPRELIAPKETPREEPREAEPVPSTSPSGEAGDPYGAAGGVPAEPVAVGAPPSPPPPVKLARRMEPVNLPEEATPPVPDAGNEAPAYPEMARSAGKEGHVILKVVVSENGRITGVEVLRGDAVFVEAALKVVRRWSYKPATLGGRPIAVFSIVKIPFRLSVGG